MSTHKHFDKICCVVLAVTLIITALFMNGEKLGLEKTETSSVAYEEKLFDTSTVHTIDIVMDDWDTFVENCQSEEYSVCSVVIDNEACKNVAIRAKGNTSLTQVAAYGNNRYSFKIEFDRYDSTKTYHGLDKLCLNNIIQDNTYMKDYLTYQMMLSTGVAAPLCSFAYITVNGEDWGLYLAVEGIEDGFLSRNFGTDSGELYKPDSSSLGGGKGNGKEFDMDKIDDANTDTFENSDGKTSIPENSDNAERQNAPQLPDNSDSGTSVQMPDGNAMPNGNFPQDGNPPELPDGNSANGGDIGNTNTDGEKNGGDFADKGNFGGGMMSSDDVLLKYIDDDTDSYPNIFDNAKTVVTESDKKRLVNSLKNLSECENLEETVDIEKVIKYFAVHNFVLNFDSYTGSMIHNYYLYEKDGVLQMIPWDYNLAFGGFQSMGSAENLVNYPIDTPVSGGSVEDRPMLAWIFSNEEYTALYHKYFSEFIEDYFESGYFEKTIEETVSLISPYIEKDPTKFCTYEEFETGSRTLKEFCLLRAKSIRGQLDGTIGSTSDTQTADTLIDAGDLKISDMGSMNNSANGLFSPDNQSKNSNVPTEPNTENKESDKVSQDDNSDTAETSQPNNSEQLGGNANSENIPQMPNGNAQQDGNPPELPDGNTGQSGNPPQMPNGNIGQNGNFDGAQIPQNADVPFANQAEQESDEKNSDENSTDENNVVDDNTERDNSKKNDNFSDKKPSENNRGNTKIDSDTLISAVLSIAVLIFGLIFALLFKRRRHL